MEGGRKEVRVEGGETGLGSAPAQTLPSMMWNGKGGFYFTHKRRSFHHQTVYCLRSRGQITRSCYNSSLPRMHFNRRVFLAAFAQILAW